MMSQLKLRGVRKHAQDHTAYSNQAETQAWFHLTQTPALRKTRRINTKINTRLGMWVNSILPWYILSVFLPVIKNKKLNIQNFSLLFKEEEEPFLVRVPMGSRLQFK